MTRELVWEYQYIYRKMNTNDNRIDGILNSQGRDGWELVQVLLGGTGNDAKIHGFIFKRPQM